MRWVILVLGSLVVLPILAASFLLPKSWVELRGFYVSFFIITPLFYWIWYQAYFSDSNQLTALWNSPRYGKWIRAAIVFTVGMYVVYRGTHIYTHGDYRVAHPDINVVWHFTINYIGDIFGSKTVSALYISFGLLLCDVALRYLRRS